MKRRIMKKFSPHAVRQGVLGYLFLLPWLVGFLILTAWPAVYTVYLSFNNVVQTVEGWDVTWAGLSNYDVALIGNQFFTPNMLSFILMQITYVPSITVIAFILALLLNRGLKCRALLRAIFFMPVIIMSGPVMYQLLDSGGLSGVNINTMRLLGMVSMFSYPFARALVFMFENYSVMLWFTGIPIILFISGLQKIDNGILEAAKIDAATGWQILWKITIPIIRPIFQVSVILTVVQLAAYTINPVLPQIRDAIFQTGSGLGLASAFSWIYSLAVLILIGIAAYFIRGGKDEVAQAVKLRSRTWADDRDRMAAARMGIKQRGEVK